MIIITITHHVHEGQKGAALERIGGNSDLMARQPGFVFRHTGSPDDPSRQIVTVTGWESRADMERWDAAKRAAAGAETGASIYERVERAVIEITDERWAAGMGRQSTKPN